ncbi:MAG: diguanylate cyclase [Sulfuricurvum sp.]
MPDTLNTLSSLRILYVEDDKNTQEEVAFFLEPLVSQLYTASNGKEGYELYVLHSPDLIITDIQMPIMSGIDMIKKIRQNDSKTPIFITTAYNETDYLLNAINSGVNRYILKPVNFKILLDTIRDVCFYCTHQPYSVSIDQNGTILDASKNWSNLSGYTLDEMLNTPLHNYIDPKNHSVYDDFLSVLKSAEDHLKKKIVLIHKNKKEIETILYAAKVKSSDETTSVFELEFKTLSAYIHDEELLSKELKAERFLKELIKMNLLIYKEIAREEEKIMFLQHMADLFTQHGPFEFAFVAYTDDSQLVSINQQGHHRQIDIQALFPHSVPLSTIDCPMVEVMKHQKIVLIDNLSTFPNFDTKPFLMDNGIQSIAALPLHKKSRMEKKGTFCIMLKQSYTLNDEVLELFEAITEVINMGLQSIEDRTERETLEKQLKAELVERKKHEEIIEQLAFFDPLTQLPNRRLLSDHLIKTIASNKRNGHFSALLFLDLDNFKPLNDIHGHAIGDLLLIEAANRIKNCLRESDVVARFGGDEFVMILNDLGEDYTLSFEYAMAVGEKIRAMLAKPYFLPLSDSEETVITSFIEHQCTSSIGVTVFGAQEHEQNELIKQADTAMYQAKKRGRNQIVLYKDE